MKKKIKRMLSNNKVLVAFLTGWFTTNNTIKSWIIYFRNMRKYERLNYDKSFSVVKNKRYPILQDRYMDSACLGSYFWQDLWATRKIFDNKPIIHYDIGSRVDGFIAHIASFRMNIKCIDIRPQKSHINGVEFIQADATTLRGIDDNSVESISALCSLEHFGLGRYGDEIDPRAFDKVAKSIVRVLKRDGHAYISVPIGKQHLEFDAHRVFYATTVVKAFKPLVLNEFSVGKMGYNGFEENVSIHKYDNDIDNQGNVFGLFEFVKKRDM